MSPRAAAGHGHHAAPGSRLRALRAQISHAVLHWVLLRVDDDVLERARRPFPAEPIRTLDALHLGTALAARDSIPEVRLLSVDERVRRSGEDQGFELVP